MPIYNFETVRLNNETKATWDAKPEAWREGFLRALSLTKRQHPIHVVDGDGVKLAEV